jgi:hypothetical protein
MLFYAAINEKNYFITIIIMFLLVGNHKRAEGGLKRPEIS